MKKFICSVCGYIHEGDSAPERCPMCKVPAEKFNEMQEGNGKLEFVQEHVIGVAKGCDDEMIKDLNNHFIGECTEVGMYFFCFLIITTPSARMSRCMNDFESETCYFKYLSVFQTSDIIISVLCSKHV